MRPRLRLPLGARESRTPASASPGPRPASSGTASTAPTSPTASVYLGEEGPHGAFNAIPTCAGFRAAVNDADLDYLVTSPFLNFLDPGEPVPSPEARWLRGEAAVEPDPAQRPGHGLAASSGELDPAACGPRNAPLREIPTDPRRLIAGAAGWVTSPPVAYPLENALFQWEEGRRPAGDATTPPRAAVPTASSTRSAKSCAAGSARPSPPPNWPTSTAQGTEWCQQVAMDVAPSVAGDAQALADAAFWLHLRGATDFAGGRQPDSVL